MFVQLHIGLGSFHRAHQAVFLHRLREGGDRSWSIAAGNARNDMPGTMAALAAQGGAYTLETVTPAGERTYERITAIARVIPFAAALCTDATLFGPVAGDPRLVAAVRRAGERVLAFARRTS